MIYLIVQFLSSFFSTMFLFLAMHALLDFPLQGDTIAVNKNPNSKTELQKNVPWYYWLGSHALIHGGGVWFLTHSVFLGCCETVSHFIIDYFKCQNKYSIHADQMLHVACKLLWTILFALGF